MESVPNHLGRSKVGKWWVGRQVTAVRVLSASGLVLCIRDSGTLRAVFSNMRLEIKVSI
jgi:hypothetical protein